MSKISGLDFPLKGLSLSRCNRLWRILSDLEVHAYAYEEKYSNNRMTQLKFFSCLLQGIQSLSDARLMEVALI